MAMTSAHKKTITLSPKTNTGVGNSTTRAFAPKASKGSMRTSMIVRAEGDKPIEMEPAAEVAKTVIAADPFPMNFNGFAPETINGRLAQLGFVAGLGAEITTGESFTTQFQSHPVAFGFACGLITLASFMPNMQGATEYTSNPDSVITSGPFTADAEKLNGRAAMLGMVAMLATEYIKGGALIG
eukprot:CAMPEP_0197847342 /NCGR_PEP_ID=MMETSP1438-20131217/5748_1 /TAXON_ID=1461541 /ORGANISM="Pterosperma sp., Strain CCMP1384" /LENGTH=183 /DNA_ID=CAMNT_0043459231 /DNA_START=87 /DNA_END=638 /DNA_ORIENTATION=+